jgi:hypothetical protein
VSCAIPPQTAEATSDNGYLIGDTVYYNKSAMNTLQIQALIDQYPASCLLSANYPSGLSWATFREPTSYFDYGVTDVSPAQIIWKASQLYSINPQVILTTLEKEQNLVTGMSGCAAWKYNSSMGYNCPDGSENNLKSYPNLGVTNTCVAKESNVTFSRQVNHAAWQLSFDGKRANGELSWMDDGATYYAGRMTQGWRSRITGDDAAYYDGYTTIDGTSVYLRNGPTAALYNYTPHFNNFRTIFTKWFGDIDGGYITSEVADDLFKVHTDANGFFSPVVTTVTRSQLTSFVCYQEGAQYLANGAYGTLWIRINQPVSGWVAADNAMYQLIVSTPGLTSCPTSLMPVYRAYNPGNERHLWTTDSSEISFALSQLGFKEGSPSFFAVQPANNSYSGRPVWRLYNKARETHFYTADPAERDFARDTLGFIDEGYAFGVSYSGSPNTKPVWRLYNKARETHFYTADPAERDFVVQKLGFSLEGIAFLIPD